MAAAIWSLRIMGALVAGTGVYSIAFAPSFGRALLIALFLVVFIPPVIVLSILLEEYQKDTQ